MSLKSPSLLAVLQFMTLSSAGSMPYSSACVACEPAPERRGCLYPRPLSLSDVSILERMSSASIGVVGSLSIVTLGGYLVDTLSMKPPLISLEHLTALSEKQHTAAYFDGGPSSPSHCHDDESAATRQLTLTCGL